ncbi:hypothetical protein SDC9_45819 [bioreactor metagenome]|uniref:Uncharacterized protein n=1 Tax=bioreactor metagenome TaxID=1076179 RepID=A0A644W791_9ZZZZ
MIQEPGNFRGCEIRAEKQSAFLLEKRSIDMLFQLLDELRAPEVLPDDCIVPDLAGFWIPGNDCLSLVGDADARNVTAFEVGRLQSLADALRAVVPNLPRIVLDPTGLGINLLVFQLIRRDETSFLVKHNKTGTGRALVQSSNVFHANPPL